MLTNVSSLRPRDLRLLATMARLLVEIAWRQRRGSMEAFVVSFDGRGRSRPLPRVSVDRLVWLATGLSRRVYGEGFCLKRSLLLFYFLRNWGCDVRICFGVAQDGTGLAGHAWVEVDGRPLAESEASLARFGAAFSYPPTYEPA